MQIFVADDKFGDVIAALEARGGWRRHAHLSFPRPALRWTNYARVPWPRVQPEQLVNHLQHAVLFSQKDRLAALLAAYQGKAEVAGDAGAVVDAFYPRTFDLRRPTAWRELRQWAVYSEAVAVLKRFQRRGEEADPTVVRCAVAFIQAVLRDDDFFKRTRGVDSHLNAEDDEGVAVMEPTPRESTPRSSADYVHVDAAEWRLLSSRWVADAPAVEEHPPLDEAVVSREAVADLLEQLAARDPQFSAVSDASGEGEEGGCVWICKPSNLSQGRGITLVRSLDDLAAVVSPSQDDEAGAPDASGQPKAAQQWVVQKYVERPLLCQGGRKFDLRQWVLVTALPPAAQVFWYRDCYLRFCSRPFSLGTASSRQDRFAHLSNYSVQKDFVADEDRRGEAPPSFESMWSSERFRDSLRETHGSDVWMDVVLPRMQSVAKHTLRAVLPELRMVGKGFEWLGFDFLLDEDLRVWLLEVNVSPDVSHSTRVTADLVPRATSDALALVLDPRDEVSPDNRWLPMTI